MKGNTSPTAGVEQVHPSLTRGWPSLLITGLVIVAAVYSFSHRPNPPFAPTQVFADKLIVNGLARQGARMIAVGEEGIVLTTDNPAGEWTRASVKPERGSTLTQVLFVDERTALAVGHDAWIVRSEDAGASWSEVFFDAEKSEPLLGIAGPFGGTKSRSDDLQVVNGTLYAVGAFGRFLVSTDQGKTWQAQTHAVLIDRHVNAMAQAADGSLLAVGERGLMAQSRDAGATWAALPEIYPGSFYGVLSLPSKPVPSSAGTARTEGALLVHGMRGNVFVSADFGKNWTKSEVPGNNSLFGGTVTDAGQVILVGAANTIMVSDDGGAHFRQVSERDRFALSAVLPMADGTLLAAGEGGLGVRKPLDAAVKQEQGDAP